MNKKKQIIKSTDWLIRGYSKEEIARMKAKAINEANEELYNKEIEEMANDIWTSCPTPDMNIREATFTAEKLYNIGYRKQIKATGMIPFITNYAKVYSQVEEKVSTIYKLSELIPNL